MYVCMSVCRYVYTYTYVFMYSLMINKTIRSVFERVQIWETPYLVTFLQKIYN